MNKMLKYIISKEGVPIIFGCDLIHDEVFMKESVSAGFLVLRYDIGKNSFCARCFGESKSLKVKSRLSVDAEIIQDFFNF